MPFGGDTYDRERDKERLSSQLMRVRAYMSRHEWVTLEELHQHCGGTVSSCSARVRDLRKSKFGGHTVDRRHIKDGLFEYRLRQPDLFSGVS